MSSIKRKAAEHRRSMLLTPLLAYGYLVPHTCMHAETNMSVHTRTEPFFTESMNTTAHMPTTIQYRLDLSCLDQ
jgi:hypothetical protein